MSLSLAYLKKRLPAIKDGRLLEDILAHGMLRSIPAGQTVLTEKQYIEFVPLVTKGGLKVVRYTKTNNKLFLYFLSEGDTCPLTLSSSLKREVSMIRAQTIADTDLLLLPIERVYYYTRHFCGWNEFAISSFRLKFDSVLGAFEGMAFTPMEDRILGYLKGISMIKNDQRLEITHETIAEDLGASRVGVSRILKRLEESKDLLLGRGHITLSASPG